MLLLDSEIIYCHLHLVLGYWFRVYDQMYGIYVLLSAGLRVVNGWDFRWLSGIYMIISSSFNNLSRV